MLEDLQLRRDQIQLLAAFHPDLLPQVATAGTSPLGCGQLMADDFSRQVSGQLADAATRLAATPASGSIVNQIVFCRALLQLLGDLSQFLE